MIEIRTVEEMVLRRLHKYLKVFEKELERMLIKKTWDHAIDFREEFVLKKGKDISIVKNKKREDAGICERSAKKEVYSTIKITTNITSILCTKEGWEEKNGIRL